MTSALLAGILVALLFSIFFSGIEVAFLSANKLQVELEAKQGLLSGRIMSFFNSRPTWFIGTTLIGNVASLILFAGLSTRLIVPVLIRVWPTLASLWLLIIVLTFLLTLIVLYTAEFLSKSLFIINSNQMLRVLAIPFTLVSVILFPVVFTVVTLARVFTVSVLRLEYSTDKPVFGLTDVNQYLSSMHRLKPDDENLELDKKILSNALEFRTVRIRDCMIPRTEIVGLKLESGIRELQKAFIESGHSKIIIYKDTIDDVIGYCHSSALFKRPQKIEEILTPIITVPETTLANELMIRFINERKSIAIAIDEFGGTSGMVSMEDIMEEIFGEIEDEHDEDDLIEQKLSEHSYRFSARIEIDYLNEHYGWELPSGDYETLGGLILTYAEDIPKRGETIEVPPYTFVIESRDPKRVNVVRMYISPAEKSS